MAGYTYILSDFLNNKYNSDTLTDEIVASSISGTLERIDGNALGCSIYFIADLSAPDQTTLDTVVANHTGELPINPLVISEPLFIADVSAGGPPTNYFAKDASGQIIDSNIPVSVYGSYFHLSESLVSSTTTEKVPQDKVTMITSNLPAGTYKISAAWIGIHTSANSDMRFDITIGGVSQGTRSEMHIEPKDADNSIPFNRILFPVLSGINTIVLRYWNSGSSTTISDATIELIRVL